MPLIRLSYYNNRKTLPTPLLGSWYLAYCLGQWIDDLIEQNLYKKMAELCPFRLFLYNNEKTLLTLYLKTASAFVDFWLNLAISVHLSVTLCIQSGKEWLEMGPWIFIYSISMKNKLTIVFFFFFFFFFFQAGFFLRGFLSDLFIWRQMVDSLCAQLLTQFSTIQFETLQALLSWCVDVHVFWRCRQFNVCHFFRSLNLAIFWCLSITVNACLRKSI